MEVNWNEVTVTLNGKTIEAKKITFVPRDREIEKAIMIFNDHLHGRNKLNYDRYIGLLHERMSGHRYVIYGITYPLVIWEATEVRAHMNKPGFSFYERFLKLYFGE